MHAEDVRERGDGFEPTESGRARVSERGNEELVVERGEAIPRARLVGRVREVVVDGMGVGALLRVEGVGVDEVGEVGTARAREGPRDDARELGDALAMRNPGVGEHGDDVSVAGLAQAHGEAGESEKRDGLGDAAREAVQRGQHAAQLAHPHGTSRRIPDRGVDQTRCRLRRDYAPEEPRRSIVRANHRNVRTTRGHRPRRRARARRSAPTRRRRVHQ